MLQSKKGYARKRFQNGCLVRVENSIKRKDNCLTSWHDEAHASSPEFDPLSWRLGHENISTAILPLPPIQEEQLSVTGERMCTKYW